MAERKRGLRTRFSLRATLFTVSFIAIVGAVYAGTLVRLPLEDAQQVVDQVGKFPRDFGPLAGAIFLNNVRWALVGLIPFMIGPILMLLPAFGTGVGFGAAATISGQNPLLVFSEVFLFPFSWMEFVAYSLATSEAIYVTILFARAHLRRRIVVELRNMAVVAAVAVLLLGVGALTESFLITLFQ